ncbi:type VII secretion protein EccE [Actinosynnema sp. CA-248983]
MTTPPPTGQPVVVHVDGVSPPPWSPQPHFQPVWAPPPPPRPRARPTFSVELPPVTPVAPPTRSRRALGPLRLPQLLCWQLAVVAVVAALDQPWPVFTAVVVAALTVLALTAVRHRGRWLWEWVLVGLSFLRRDRSLSLDLGESLIALLAPNGTGIETGLDDEPVFLVSTTPGVTAVLRPSAQRDLTKAVPSPDALLPDTGEEFAVRFVHHAGTDHSRPPRVWVALQALRTVEAHREEDVRRALGNAVRRVRRKLRRDGVEVHALPMAETVATVSALAHLTGGRTRAREGWRLWWSGPVAQAAFRLDGWDRLPPSVAPQLLRWLLTAVPQAAVTVSVTARTGHATEAVVRVAAADPRALDSAAGQVARLAKERGIVLERLDGRHRAGLAATLPLGVTR